MSLSRPAHSRPQQKSRPTTQSRPSTKQRPSTGQKRSAQSRPTRPSQQPNRGQRPSNRSVENFLGVQRDRPSARPSTRPADRPGRPGGDRPGRPGDGDRPGRPGDRPGRPGDRPDRGDRWKDRGDYVRDHYHHHLNDHFNDNYWWRRAGWATAIGWAGYNWGTPYYYGYSDDGSWGYYDDASYYGGGSETSYSDQQAAITETADTADAADGEWLPLGMFALTSQEETAADPNGYMQLSLSKDGTLSGYYHNSTTGESFELVGMVDKDTQLAAWQLTDSDNSPIVETGIFNLTKDETPARVHFADGRTQDVLLVALNQDSN